MSISTPKTKIVAAFGKRPAAPHAMGDATLEFGVETAIAVKEPAPPRAPIPPGRRIAPIVAATVLVGAMGAAVYWADSLKVPTAAPTGSLKIETDPAGAEVRIDGKVRGTTPLSLSLPVGQYVASVKHGDSVKELPVSVATGAATVHHLTWTDAVASTSTTTGNLTVTADQPGGRVNIDGQDRGAAPLTVRNLTPGQHRVVVRSGGTTFTRTVQIEAGVTASLVLSAGGVAPWGWVTVTSPVPVQLFEGDRLIGTSDIERIMLPGGGHELVMVADQIGYRATRSVRVSAGQATRVVLEPPTAAVSINAVPWAEVSIDGTRVGETPLGNLSIAAGPHEIVFRHPQLGERRMTTLISLKEPNRVSMDMRSR